MLWIWDLDLSRLDNSFATLHPLRVTWCPSLAHLLATL